MFDEIIIELSYNCNLSCIMCGFGKEHNPFSKDKFLSFDNYKRILAEVGSKTKTIRLNGRGESLIHPDFVDILNFTKREYPHVNINLFSNFSIKNDNLIKCLVQNNVQLFVSVDSPVTEEIELIRKGANFTFIKNNIQALSGMVNRPFIVFTVQEANLHRILDIALFALKNSCSIIYNTIRRDEGIEDFLQMVEENYLDIEKKFAQVAKLFSETQLQCLIPDQFGGIKLKSEDSMKSCGSHNSCPVLDKELCILYDGTVTPCNMFNPYVYGNIFKTSIEELFESNKRKNFIHFHKNHYYCKNCANLGV